MFTKENILYHAQRAGMPDEFLNEISQYLDFANNNADILSALHDYYNKLFNDEKAIFPIHLVRDIPLPEESEKLYPGFFSTVIFLAAAGHFLDYVAASGFDTPELNLADTYYKNLRRFMQMNFVRDNTYALLRHGYFLYGYAKPFSLRIGRLAYELRQFCKSDKYVVCTDCDGNRIFAESGKAIPDGLTRLTADGEKYVTIHIPGEGRLDEKAIANSLEKAIPILRSAFKSYSPRQIMCTSWILSPQLRSFLKPDSNIMKFQAMFDIVQGDIAPNAIHENIFKIPLCPVEEIVPQNTFQASVLEVYKKDGAIFNGIGILKERFGKL